MFKRLSQHLDTLFQRRRATQALGKAMRAGDLAAMGHHLTQNPHLDDRLKMTFEEPMRHFQETYQVSGALRIAAELNMPMEAFRMLLEAGARPLPNGECILHHGHMHRPDAQQILDMVQNMSVDGPALEAATPKVSLKVPGRRL